MLGSQGSAVPASNGMVLLLGGKIMVFTHRKPKVPHLCLCVDWTHPFLFGDEVFTGGCDIVHRFSETLAIIG